MERALSILGQNTTPTTTLSTPNEVAGSDMQRALDLNKVTPSAYTFQPNAVQDALANSKMDVSDYPGRTNDLADRYLFANEAQEKEGRTPRLVPPRYEGIVSAADLGSQFPGPVAQPVGYTFQPNAVNNLLSSLGLPAENNATVERYLAENQNISPTQFEGIVSAADLGSQFPGLTKTTTQEQADRIKALAAESGGYTPEKDIYGQLIDPQKIVDAYTKQIEKNEKLIEAAINFPSPDIPLARREENIADFQSEADRARELRDAFLNYGGLENQYNAIKYTDPTTRDYKTPFVNYLEEPTLKSEEEQKKELDKIIQSYLSETPSSFFGPATLLAGTDYTGGIPSTTIGDYSFGREPIGPDTSGLNLGTLDSNQLKETFPGAFNPFEASLAVTVYGPDGTEYGSPAQAMAAGVTNYTMSPPVGVPITPTIRPLDPYAVDADYANTPAPRDRLGELSASYGGLGTAWQGVTGRDGSPVLTSQGLAEKNFLSSPLGITTSNMEAAKNYAPPQDPAQRQQAATAPAPAPQPMMTVTERWKGEEAPNPDLGYTKTRIGRDDYLYTRQVQVPSETTDDGEGGFRTSPVGGWGSYGNNAGPSGRGGATDASGLGGTSYGAVDPGYRGGSEAAQGGLSTSYGFQRMAHGGISSLYNLGSYSDGGRLLKGPGDGVSDDIPATIGRGQPARLADGEFVIPARIVSELGNGSTDAGARKLYAMMDRIQKVRRKTKNVAANTKAAKHLPA